MKNKVFYAPDLTAATALHRAARTAGVDVREISDEQIVLNNGYYEIRFTDGWLLYDCAVDAVTGEVPGLSASPAPAA